MTKTQRLPLARRLLNILDGPPPAVAGEGAAAAKIQLDDATDPNGGPRPRSGEFRRVDILRWIYLSRIGLAGGVFAGAVLAWAAASPLQTLTASLLLVTALILTPLSYWYTHVQEARPDTSFIYAQALFDTLLVTAIVDLTGGSDSVVAPFYILLISAYTLMLPLRGGFLVAGMACMAYIADVVWGQGTNVDTVVALQLTIFVAVALFVGLIATKLQETGAELSHVEHELRQLRLDTGDILGNIPTAVLTVDGEGRLAYLNPAAEELLGIDGDAWLDQPVMEELKRRSRDLPRLLERTQNFRVAVSSAEIEVRRSGGAVPVGVTTAVLDRKEGPPSVTAIMRDISDRKRMEELRKQAERLEAVAELSASLAHEIRNPLASISSSVQQLQLARDFAEDDKLLARLILKESDRLSRLLGDFIDFSRVPAVNFERLDLRDIVEHALEVVRQHPSCHEDVVIEADFATKPVQFQGDEDLMYRVVTNLVLNAVQVAERGRRTTIRIEVLNGDIRTTPRGVNVSEPRLLKVTDDGPGIESEDLKRIFDPFFSGRGGGSGLGLAIVHKAVTAHHGTVLVESSPGRGARFTVCLPAHPPASKEAAAGGIA